jgi:hypothetical protein
VTAAPRLAAPRKTNRKTNRPVGRAVLAYVLFSTGLFLVINTVAAHIYGTRGIVAWMIGR